MLVTVEFTAINCQTGAEQSICGKWASGKTNRFDGFRDFPYPLVTVQVLLEGVSKEDLPPVGSWFCLGQDPYRLYGYRFSSSCRALLTLLQASYPCSQRFSVVRYYQQELCSDFPEPELIEENLYAHLSNQQWQDQEDDARRGLRSISRLYMTNYQSIDWSTSCWLVSHSDRKHYHVRQVDDLGRMDRIPFLGVVEEQAPWIAEVSS